MNNKILSGTINREILLYMVYSDFNVILMLCSVPLGLNDQKGHLTGDMVLKVFSRVVADLIRPDDFFARWGGDEFIIIVEAKKEEAVILAERLRKTVSDKALYKSKNGEKNRVTLI